MSENRSCPQSDMALFYDDEKNSFIILQKSSRSGGASTSAFLAKRIELAWFCAQSISLPQAGCAQATGRPPGSIAPTGSRQCVPRSPGLSQGLPGRLGWQLLQNTVMRCCTSREVKGALQVVHGRPARPYTLCSFWNDPQPPSAVR